jgi:membrane fusion protein, copper/silver efflux system
MTRNQRLILSGLALAVAFALGFVLRGPGSGGAADPHAGHDHGPAAAAEPTVWTCSMHPQFQLPSPGECPICFMDLIPLEDDGQEGLGPRDLVLSESAVALAEIRTAPVMQDFAVREVALVGKVAVDETRQRVISARVPGRIERLFVDYTGRTVQRGEKLAEIYSPELYRARAELLAARQAAERGEPGSDRNLAAIHQRLRLWDLDPERVAAADGERIIIDAPTAGTVIRRDALEGAYVEIGTPLVAIADLGRVWVELAAFERDLVWLEPGQTVTFSVLSLPGEVFEGRLVFIDPVLDERSRTVRVRLEAENPDGRLRPGMLARGRVQAELAADGRPRAGRPDAQPPVIVPATAPLLTGERAVVYLRLPGDEAHFQGREVVLGPRAGDWFIVREGLAVGDQVVVHGAFKLDSALQIQARPSMMLPEETPPQPELPDVPACFANMAPSVVAAYLDLQAALAADDHPAAQAAAGGLVAVFGDHCTEAIPDLVTAATAVADAADDIEAMRTALQPLSDVLWLTVSAVGWRGEEPLLLMHCPMAFDDTGADWLQTSPTVANPYYGARMLRCGYETARLSTAEEDSP